MVYGERARRLMITAGFNPDKIKVIYNSLEYEKQLEIRERITESNIYKKYFKNDFPIIIFTGRLTKIKKLDQLLKAQKILFEQGMKFNDHLDYNYRSNYNEHDYFLRSGKKVEYFSNE